MHDESQMYLASYNLSGGSGSIYHNPTMLQTLNEMHNETSVLTNKYEDDTPPPVEDQLNNRVIYQT
jgi:hypothetical protein